MIPYRPESILTKPDAKNSDPASASIGQKGDGAEGLINLMNVSTELAQNLARQSAALMGALGVREVPLSSLQIDVTPFEAGLFNDLWGAGSATVYNLNIAIQQIETILKILGEYYEND